MKHEIVKSELQIRAADELNRAVAAEIASSGQHPSLSSLLYPDEGDHEDT
jgi:hypothetical protein